MLYHINDTVNTLLTHHQTCDTISYNMSGFEARYGSRLHFVTSVL
jgi:hypothetical protein